MKLKLMALTFIAVLATGCAAPAQMQLMIPETNRDISKLPQQLKSNIFVQSVSGGEKTNPLWTSEISSNGYKTALEQSLANAGLLGVIQDDSNYHLIVSMIKVSQPMIGLGMTVNATVKYQMKEIDSGKIVLSEIISRPYTAKFSDAVIAVYRLQKANEGAARENIKAFIDRLSNLNLGMKGKE
jgi:hypothetical protein|tara:strand:+ start:106 stop:657 length:552 start_codon:yes stop_codon:yes gene_type:complete